MAGAASSPIKESREHLFNVRVREPTVGPGPRFGVSIRRDADVTYFDPLTGISRSGSDGNAVPSHSWATVTEPSLTWSENPQRQDPIDATNGLTLESNE